MDGMDQEKRRNSGGRTFEPRSVSRRAALAGMAAAGFMGSRAFAAKLAPESWRVYASIEPLAAFVNELAGAGPSPEAILTECLNPSLAGCPHGVALTPRQYRRLASGKERAVLLVNGLGLESDWLLNEGRAKGWNIVTAGEAIPEESLLPEDVEEEPGHAGEGHDHEHEHGHVHEAVHANPHVWASPVMAAAIIRHVGARLAGLMTYTGDRLIGKAETLAAQWEELAAETRAMMAQHTAQPRILVMDASFDYMARDQGWIIAGRILPHGATETSPRRLSNLLRRLKADPPAAVAAQPQYDPRLARLASRELGVPLVTLDPFTAPAGRTYAQVQGENLKNLMAARRGPV